jgi:hypothetical protein
MEIKMSKWINFQSYWGLGGNMILFDKVNFYAGKSENWGIGIKVGFYDRSLTFEILNLYMGVEIFHSYKEYDKEEDWASGEPNEKLMDLLGLYEQHVEKNTKK